MSAGWAIVPDAADYASNLGPHLRGSSRLPQPSHGGVLTRSPLCQHLYLIARYVGLQEAIEVAKVYMLQWHELGQQPFATLMSLRQTDDPLINQCQRWLEENFRRPAPVAAMVATSSLPERTFARRFRKATGLTPLDYVHAVRLEEAKRLLELGESSVESIALQVGYEDATFFGRLFRRRVGMTPARYRARFGALRQLG